MVHKPEIEKLVPSVIILTFAKCVDIKGYQSFITSSIKVIHSDDLLSLYKLYDDILTSTFFESRSFTS